MSTTELMSDPSLYELAALFWGIAAASVVWSALK